MFYIYFFADVFRCKDDLSSQSSTEVFHWLALNNAIKLEEMNMITLFPAYIPNNNVYLKYEKKKNILPR